MIVIDERGPQEAPAAEALLMRVFGGSHLRKTSQRLRAGRLPAEGLHLVAREDGGLVGSVQLWEVALGRQQRPALLLGPLAVRPELQGAGLGAQLMRVGLARAAERGHGGVILVGDAPYYQRFGFCARRTQSLYLPGPFERHRFLGLELKDGWLEGLEGGVAPIGKEIAAPALVAA